MERKPPRAGKSLIRTAAQRRKIMERRKNKAKPHTLYVKLAWMSAIWQGWGFRKRASKSTVPEKAYFGSSLHPMKTEKKKPPF